MTTASTLAKLAKTAAKGSKDAEVLIEAASVVVTAASVLMKEAKPVLDEIDTDAIASKVRESARTAAESAGKATGAMKEAAGGAAGAVSTAFAKLNSTRSGIASNLADVKAGIMEDLSGAKTEKELRRAIKEARQTVLENATTKITVADLQKAIDKAPDAIVGPINDMPGCFVIATYRKLDFDNDLTDYTGIFVGESKNAYKGVLAALSRSGDPDVYADVKFKQNVHVYVYNCLAENLEGRYLSLRQTFEDERLYGSMSF